MRGRKLRTNILKFSLSNRCASLAMVSNTTDDFPEPDTPVKMMILRLCSLSETSLRLFSRAPRISIYSCTMLIYVPSGSFNQALPGFRCRNAFVQALRLSAPGCTKEQYNTDRRIGKNSSFPRFPDLSLERALF